MTSRNLQGFENLEGFLLFLYGIQSGNAITTQLSIFSTTDQGNKRIGAKATACQGNPQRVS